MNDGEVTVDHSAEHSGVRAPRLVVIGTPIGNLSDLSPRARRMLADCDVLACEDTRRTGRLLQLSGISPPRLVRLDAHTESDAARRIIDRALAERAVIGLVSDAGMPGISDPGSLLVSAAIDADIPVEVVPGPFAGVVALVASGLVGSDSRFVFEGFLPRRSTQRRERLGELAGETRPVVVYEAPHRLMATLADMTSVLGGDRRVSISRELTKMHEETLRGTLDDVVKTLGTSPPRGEFVIVVDGAPPTPAPGPDEMLDAYRDLMSAGWTSRDAIHQTAQRFGVSANTVKRLVFAKE